MHRGEMVRQVLEDLGVKKQPLATKMGIVKSTLYNYFLKEDLEWSLIRKIGKIINYDFKQNFPEMPSGYEILEPQATVINESYVTYNNYELRKELIKCKDKLIDLMEENIQLRKQLQTVL